MKILIVDDHTLFRSGMVHLLQSMSPPPSVLESDGVHSALQILVKHADIDLVLLDLNLDDAIGVEALLRLRDQITDTTIVVLSGEQDPGVIRQCIDAGAMGFITKTSTHDELLSAIKLTVAGGVYLPSSVKTRNFQQVAQASKPGDVALLASLSGRQREVLTYLVQGKPNKTISSYMDISENTVKAHLSAIFKTLGARNRTEAVYFAARAGVPLD